MRKTTSWDVKTFQENGWEVLEQKGRFQATMKKDNQTIELNGSYFTVVEEKPNGRKSKRPAKTGKRAGKGRKRVPSDAPPVRAEESDGAPDEDRKRVQGDGVPEVPEVS